MLDDKKQPEGICDNCLEDLIFYLKGQKYCRICGLFEHSRPEVFRARTVTLQ